MAHESIYNMVLESDPNNQLRKVMEQKRPPDHQLCQMDFILADLDRLNNFDFSKVFFLMNKSSLFLMLTVSSRSLSCADKLIFDSVLFDQELLQVQYISKAMPSETKQLVLKG